MSVIKRDELEEKEALASELRGSLLEFTKYFFPVLTSRELIVSQPIGRESHHVIIARALTRAARLQIPSHRLLINTPPGSGKSLMMTMFVAWTMAQYPDSKYIYVSYSKTLADKMTEQIKRIMQLPHYSYLFDVHIRTDSKAKDYFQTTAGGAIASAGAAGTITGLSAAEPGLDRFSGALICFPHDELIYTEKGTMKIGDVVDNKIDVNVYSFNLKTRQIELKKIERYFENPGSNLVEIVFDDNSTLRCTPDHKIWTDNRGWVEAQDLLSSDELLSIFRDSVSFNAGDSSGFCNSDVQIENNLPLIVTKSLKSSLRKSMLNSESLSIPADSMSFYAKLSSQIANFRTRVFQPFYLMLCQSFKFIKTPFWSESFGSFCPGSASPNLLNRENRETIVFCNNSCPFSCQAPFANIDSFLCSDFSCACVKSSVSNHVIKIVLPSSVGKIFNSIVVTISVKMSDFKARFPGSYKRFGNDAMNGFLKTFPKKIQADIKIPFSTSIFPRLPWLQNSFFKNLNAIFENGVWIPLNNPGFTSDPSVTRNTVKAFKTRNRSPLFIRKIGHVDKTYCLTVKDNHNMFMGSNGVITSNCDDLHKPDEVSSATLREKVIANFSQTLQQRLRSVKAPIIMIGQRLHESDISQYLIDEKDGYQWEKVILKAIDEAGNYLYPEVYSKEMLLKKKETDPYVFSSQYQQEPVPAGGALFKPDWFVLLDDEPTFIATFVVADTAETSMTYNDATAISFFGLYEIENFGRKTGVYALHWIDAIEIHVEPKDLKETFLSFWEHCSRHKTPPRLAAIEKKSTGVSLISALSEMRGIRVLNIERNRSSGSKTKRFLDTQPFAAERLISLPALARHSSKCIEHMSKITANDTHARDDLADTLCDGVRIALAEKTILISSKAGSESNEQAASVFDQFNKINSLRKSAYAR